MNTKKLLQLLMIASLLFTSFAFTERAQAISDCSATVVVQWGDTLSGIAAYCGTTMDAIRAVNPGLGWWLYAGQVLKLPTGSSPAQAPLSGGSYVVQAGDTLKVIATRAGVTIDGILAVNPEITNMNLIYVGQVIKLPTGNAPAPVPTAGAPTTIVTPPPATQPAFQPLALAFSPLRIKYKHGMYIRNTPNGTIIASAVDGDTLYYKPGSDISDAKGRIWIEVRLYPPTQGYTTGWLLVRDQYGTFFTKPRFRPLGELTQ